jgi:hypothetical protein
VVFIKEQAASGLVETTFKVGRTTALKTTMPPPLAWLPITLNITPPPPLDDTCLEGKDFTTLGDATCNNDMSINHSISNGNDGGNELFLSLTTMVACQT